MTTIYVGKPCHSRLRKTKCVACSSATAKSIQSSSSMTGKPVAHAALHSSTWVPARRKKRDPANQRLSNGRQTAARERGPRNEPRGRSLREEAAAAGVAARRDAGNRCRSNRGATGLRVRTDLRVRGHHISFSWAATSHGGRIHGRAGFRCRVGCGMRFARKNPRTLSVMKRLFAP